MAISGIPMKEIPVAIGMGKINGTIVVDLNKIEDNFSDSDVPMALNRKNEFLLLQADGLLTKEEFKKICELAVEKIKTVRKEQIDAIKNYYKIIGE
jgi:exosome complex component RRP41